jgi:hypothetical protein
MIRRRLCIAAFCAAALIALPHYPAKADSELAVARPTFYVIAPGGDPNVAAIAASVTTRLQQLFDGVSPNARVWVISRLGWSPEDLANQCINDPTKFDAGGAKVLGGLILDGTNSYVSGVNSYVFWTRAWSKLTTRAQLVSCRPLGYGKPTITWSSDDLAGYASRNGFPIELAAVSALYFSSHNDSNARSLALGASISAFDSTAAVPPVDPVDANKTAAHRTANDLMDKLKDECATAVTLLQPLCVRLGYPTQAPAPPPLPAPTATPTP